MNLTGKYFQNTHNYTLSQPNIQSRKLQTGDMTEHENFEDTHRILTLTPRK